jgi:hypothetical protein
MPSICVERVATERFPRGRGAGAGWPRSVGTALAEERGHLLLRVAEGFDLTDV